MSTCLGCGALVDGCGVDEVIGCENCPPVECEQCRVVAKWGECGCWVDVPTLPDGKWAASLMGLNVEVDGRWVR